MPAIPYRNELVVITNDEMIGWQVNYGADSATGPCPACRDTTEASFATEAVSMEMLRPDDTRPRGFTRLFQCNCGVEHLDGSVIHPKCGRRWLVEIMPEGTEPPVVAARDYSLLAAATALSEDKPKKDAAQEQSLIKASAEKWIAGVTALFSLFGLSGLIVAKDTVASLGTLGKVLTGVALLAAIALAAAAIVLSYRAAYGWPKVVDLRQDDALRKWFEDRQAYASRAAGFLQQSVVLALGALAALLLAVAFVWFLPGSGTPEPLVKMTLTDGSSACGKLVNSSADAHLRIQAPSGTIQDVPAAEVVRSVGVTSCTSP